MAALALKLEPVIVSRKELLALRAAEEAYSKAKMKLETAEKILKPLRLALAEKVLGVSTFDELQALSPNDLKRLLERRTAKKLWKAGQYAPGFRFIQSHSGRYPSWKAEFIEIKGEVAAESIIADTPTIFSYRVEVGT